MRTFAFSSKRAIKAVARRKGAARDVTAGATSAESREGKTVVLSFMAFPSAKPDDKGAKTQVGEIAISPDGKATTEAKTAEGKSVKVPNKMIVSGQYPEYAQGYETYAYEDEWDASDTARKANPDEEHRPKKLPNPERVARLKAIRGISRASRLSLSLGHPTR